MSSVSSGSIMSDFLSLGSKRIKDSFLVLKQVLKQVLKAAPRLFLTRRRLTGRNALQCCLDV